MTHDGTLLSLVDLEIKLRPSTYYPDAGPAIIKAGQRYPYHIGTVTGCLYVYAGEPHKWITLRNGEYII